MITNHIKAILTSLRAMVIKMLPAYKFYLGSTTETTTTQICHGVMSVKDGQTQGNGALTLDDASFAGFVEGETYTVVVNGVSGEYVAKVPAGTVMVSLKIFQKIIGLQRLIKARVRTVSQAPTPTPPFLYPKPKPSQPRSTRPRSWTIPSCRTALRAG